MLRENNLLFYNGNDDLFLKYRDENVFNDKKSIKECFKHFAKNNAIDRQEFERLLKYLYRFNGNSYYIPRAKTQRLFDFYKDKSIEKIGYKGFELFWFQIIKKSLFPRSALIVVDVQNDFIDGTLSLKNCPSKHDGAEVVPVINNLIHNTKFNAIAYTLDWHPSDHCSFFENINDRKISPKSPVVKDFKLFDTVRFDAFPNVEQKLWPAHCIQETVGAELHKNLEFLQTDNDPMNRKIFVAKKGTNHNVDSYSPFFNQFKMSETDLDTDLKREGITDLYVCGLAYDVCVAFTALDALDLDYRVIVVDDACRGVDVKSIREQKETLIRRGAILVNSKQVNNMVNARDRRPELGFSSFLMMKPHLNE